MEKFLHVWVSDQFNYLDVDSSSLYNAVPINMEKGVSSDFLL